MSNVTTLEEAKAQLNAADLHDFDREVLRLLRKHAHSPKQLAKATGASIRNVHYSLKRLSDGEKGLRGTVERMAGMPYYVLRGHKYSFEYKKPSHIPPAHFPELTPAEVEKAVAWIDGPEGARVAEKYLIESVAPPSQEMIEIAHDELRAHFSYSLTGCHRPSALLTTEAASVEFYANPDRLEYQSYETKTKSMFQKFVEDPRLVKWALHWAQRRLAFHYKFLFWDENSYQPRRNDSWRLAAKREKYGACYRELFEYFGKSEQIYYSDTLYCFRKLSAHFWVDKKGLTILPVVTAMGWKSETTLRDYYFDISREKARSALFGTEGPQVKA